MPARHSQVINTGSHKHALQRVINAGWKRWVSRGKTVTSHSVFTGCVWKGLRRERDCKTSLQPWQHLNYFQNVPSNQLATAKPKPYQSFVVCFFALPPSHETLSLNRVCFDQQNVLFKIFNVIFTSPVTSIRATPARVDCETLAQLRQLYRLFTSW